MFPAFSQSFPDLYRKWYTVVVMMGTFKMYHFGSSTAHRSGSFWVLLTGNIVITHTTGNTAKNSLNEPLRNITGTFFGKIQDVPITFLMGTSWSHDLGHCECTAENSLNEPPRNTAVTFFGKIQDVPMDHLMGTSQSHDLGHCKCTDHSPGQGNCREIGRENSGCTCNVPGGYMLGTLSSSL